MFDTLLHRPLTSFTRYMANPPLDYHAPAASDGHSQRMLMALRAIGFVASAVFIALSLFVAKPGRNYRFSALFLVPIVWGPYLLRRRLHLYPLHYALFAVALLLHNLGA